MIRPIACALVAVLFTACATKPLTIRRPAELAKGSRLCDVAVAPGADVYVVLIGGATARGRVIRLTCDLLEIQPPEAWSTTVSLRTDDVALLGRVKGRSQAARRWIGAGIAAALVAPFGISMPGDMVLVGALVGGIIGHNSGNSHVEVLFERTDP